MEFRLLTEKEKSVYKNQLIDMLTLSDNEFVPPLSKRSSTTQADLSPTEKSGGGVSCYFAEMSKQNILCAFTEEEILGFVSFRENYISDVISEDELPNIYVSTLILSPKARGRGLSTEMYSYLFDTLYPESAVFTRTWSTNTAHTKILSKFGFSEMLRKHNERGEGIDTVYYKKEKSRVHIASAV